MIVHEQVLLLLFHSHGYFRNIIRYELKFLSSSLQFSISPPPVLNLVILLVISPFAQFPEISC